MRKGWIKIRNALFITLLIGLVLSGCVRPTPRPENVQITEIPNSVPVPVATAIPFTPPTATPDEAIVSESATAEADSSGSSIQWPQSHEVIAGDTISRISIIYGVDAEEIIAANNLANPDTLEIGQILTIPEPGTVALTVTQAPEEVDSAGETAVTVEPSEQIYIVQAGDTLFRIALAYNTTVEELADYNNITNINALDLGQEIRIPPSN